MNPSPITRRKFITETTAVATGAVLAPRLLAAAGNPPEFRSDWHLCADRVWPGPDYWTNPLQDWRIAQGRLECIKAAPGRNIHVLTRHLGEHPGSLQMSVRLGAIEGKGSAGFVIGAQGPLKEYRNNLIFGTGLNVGIRANGELFIGTGPRAGISKFAGNIESLELRLSAEPAGESYRVRVSAHDATGGRTLGEVERSDIPSAWLVGNLALGANFGSPQPPPARRAQQPQEGAAQPPPAGPWWFADWRISGSKVESQPDHAFGPILFTQYTLHERTLKLTAQMPPLGASDNQTVRLEVKRSWAWKPVAEGAIHPQARTVTFRLTDWNDGRDAEFRVVYDLRQTTGASRRFHYRGLIRRDPRDARELSVADISCNAHYAFPNVDAAKRMLQLNPDLVAFTGDQYYEPSGGFSIDRSSVEHSILDVLRKWYLHGWTWRELTLGRPSISLPDDHDVYHGNLWGEGGAAAPGTGSVAESKGGYKMFAEFVNVVHRIQTSHHPDSNAPAGKQHITGYYGPLTYGRVSFALLADRQYKSGPDGKVPPTKSGRADHVIDPGFDPKSANVPGLELLGDGQMKFLEAWARDWRGADMKAAISQTLFTAMATHHGKYDGLLIADYDTNAWPQDARNAAVRELRRAFAFHLAGDQHLPAVVHYGVDEHRDAVAAFASPAINNLYPRWFRPPGTDRTTGDFRDSFGHPLTVLACANPLKDVRKGVLEAETDKVAGLGVVRFDKRDRTIRIDCWPLLADVSKPGTQFAGWPVVVHQLDNYARKAVAQLPELVIRGDKAPVVEIVDESTGEMSYSLRLNQSRWRPFAFAEGPHTIQVLPSGPGKSKVMKAILATKVNRGSIVVAL